jgi:hypothetical protein
MTKFVNRAKMTTATTGTGTITLGSAVDGFQTFANAGVANADVVRYVIEDGTAWEIGSGTYTATGTTLTRTVDESSNADSAINLSGSAVVYVTASASDVMNTSNPAVASGTITEDVTTTITVNGSLLSPYVIDPSLGSIQTHLIGGTQYYDDGLSLGQGVTLHLVPSGSPSLFWPTMTWVNNGGSAPTLASLTIVSLWKAYDSSDTTTLYGALVGDGT